MRTARCGSEAEEEESPMGVIMTGIIAAVVIAVGAGFVLREQQEPSWEVFSTASTRVGDPGANLVGPDFSGEAGGGAAHAEGEETPG
jgi:hypothetical protein